MWSDAIPYALSSRARRPSDSRCYSPVLLPASRPRALTRLLELVQRVVWGGTGRNLLEAAERAGAWHHILVLLGAGVVTGAGRILLRRLSSGNGIDTTAAIWFCAGRMPVWRTLGSALLSVILVGMGISLGREGAPKQADAVVANVFDDRCACRTSNGACWWPAARGRG